MPAAADQGLIDGRFADPSDRYLCHVFEAVAAFVIPEIAGLGAAELGGAALGGELAGGLGGFSALGGADIAGLTAGEVLGGGAGALLGGGEALAGGLGEVLGAGAGDIAGGIGGGVGGVGAAGPATIGAGADVAGALSPVTAGTSVAGPVAAAPALPASIVGSPTATGDLLAGMTAGEAGGGDAAAVGGGSWSPMSSTPAGATAATGSPTPGIAMGDWSPMSDVAGTTAKSGSGIDRAISSLTGGNLNKSDLGTILSGGGLLMNVLGGQKKLPGEAQINRAAGNLEATAAGQAALGTQLESFLQSGKLPPGLQTGLRSATEAAKTTIRSQYAQRGMSGSSAEAQDMQNAEDRAVAAGQQVALQLLQQGANMVGQAANTEGMAAELYRAIMANALQHDQEFGQALGNFSSALAGSGGSNNNTLTIKTAV